MKKATIFTAINALALPILKALLNNKRVINIPANLQAYFNNCRYFPILMPKFDNDQMASHKLGSKSQLAIESCELHFYVVI